ncbi:MAG: hypothetical protein WCG84_01840 [Candidatus Moraniibacteriota bacterium]
MKTESAVERKETPISYPNQAVRSCRDCPLCTTGCNVPDVLFQEVISVLGGRCLVRDENHQVGCAAQCIGEIDQKKFQFNSVYTLFSDAVNYEEEIPWKEISRIIYKATGNTLQ